MSTHNIGFYEDLTKIIFQLSSNIKYDVISSSAGMSHFRPTRDLTQSWLLAAYKYQCKSDPMV